MPPYRWTFDARALETVGAVAIDGACLRAKAQADPAFGFALLMTGFRPSSSSASRRPACACSTSTDDDDACLRRLGVTRRAGASR